MTLVRAFSGVVHRSTCATMRGHEVYKVVAPEVAESDVAAFLAARRFVGCRACFPVVRDA